MKFLSESQLETSCIVANNRMNRERVALGSNGYETDLGFDPIVYLSDKYEENQRVAWLDLCCGRGKAIVETGQRFYEQDMTANVSFVGVDLVGMFDAVPCDLDFISLVEASLHQWVSQQRFDLITCVHGLHYVGDKLSLIKRAMLMLQPNGQLFANLDLDNLRLLDDKLVSEKSGSDEAFEFAKEFRRLDFNFDRDERILSWIDSESVRAGHNSGEGWDPFSSLSFVGADDQAGPNYTGQEAVNSYYSLKPRESGTARPN